MFGNVLRRIDMFWLILLAIALTYCQIPRLDAIVTQAAVNAFTSGFTKTAMSNFRTASKILKFVKFVMIVEIIYMLFATNVRCSFSKYVDKFIVKIPDKIRSIGRRATLWLIAITGIGLMCGDLFTLVCAIGLSLPALKYELENGTLKNVD